jgi:RNA ligase
MRPSSDGCFVVFNYRETVEFDGLWNDVNVWCRGLIFDMRPDPPTIAAVPFKKFWNVGQRPELSVDALAKKGMPVDIREKLDGSLGILYLDASGRIAVSTRGSLESDQAKWATAWVNDPANHSDGSYDALCFVIEGMGLTPLVEIIYDANRIVVPYDYEGLCALAMIERSSGRVLGLNECSSMFPLAFRTACADTMTSLDELLTAAHNLPYDHEGWVVRWSDGTMAKVKGDEYVRIHRIRFGLTPKRIHEALIDGVALVDAIDGMPDELMKGARAIADVLINEAAARMRLIDNALYTTRNMTTRKEQSLCAQGLLSKELLASYFAALSGHRERAVSLAMASIDRESLGLE